MSSLISVTGNLGRDPEQRTTPSGAKVTTFSLADNHVWTDKDGNQQKQTSWWNVECWNGQGEAVMKQLKKGAKVTVYGRPQLSEYEDDKKIKRIWPVIANAKVEFLTAGPNGDSVDPSAGAPVGVTGPDDNGIPF